MSDCLEIFTFGGLRIVLNGVPMTEFTTRKVEALLVLLACTGQPYSRQQLADLLWDERAEEQALTNLRATLSRLKQHLEPFLSITRRTIGLNPQANVWVDALELPKRLTIDQTQDSLSSEYVNRIEGGLALYQGDFLAGFYVNESVGFEHWLTEQREYLRSRVLTGMSRLINHALEHGDYAAGQSHVERVLRLDPMREEAYQQSMLLLARQGQRSKALEQYQLCVQMLKRELGVTPSAVTMNLYEQISSGAIGIPIERRSSPLPPSGTPFVGRVAELLNIQRTLDGSHHRLISLIGMGGLGKTRLAYQLAQNNLQKFDDGVCFVPLVGLTSSRFLASSIAKALNLTWDASANVRDVLFAYLASRRLLLVLDNFEHLLDDDGALLVSEMLSHAPHLKILATSRERLGLYEEWVFNVPGLTYPQQFDPQFEEYGAVQLFVQGAQRVQPQFIVQQHTQSVLHICQLFEGLPLALELATYWLKVMSCEQLASELERNLALLHSSFRNFPERHSSIQLIFEYSWERLSSKEQQILTKLSVFHGSFNLQAAQSVSQATFQELDTLNSASLIRFDAETNRYSIHELLRRFSYERLGDQREATHQAHLDYFLDFTQKADEGLFGERESEWLERVDTELDNVRAALAWADQQQQRMAILYIAVHLYRFWRVHSFLTEGYSWIERGFDQMGPIEESFHAKALGRIAALSNLMGKKDQSIAYYQKGLALARQHGNTNREAAILNGLGVIASQRQDYQTARVYYEECLALCREHQYIHLQTVVLLNTAVGFQEETNYVQAKTLLFEALALARAQSHTQNMADVLHNLGGIAFEEGEYGVAAQYLEESLSLYRKIKDKVNIMAIMHIFVNLHIVQGDLKQARAISNEMLALSETVDDQVTKALVTYTLGFVSLEENAIDQARTSLIQATEKYNQLDDKRMFIFCLHELAHVAHAQDDDDAAIRLLAHAHTLLSSLQTQLHAQANKRYLSIFTTLKEKHDEQAFIDVWQQGEQMTRAEIIASLM